MLNLYNVCLSLVNARVVLFLEVVQIGGHLIPKRHQLFVTVGLSGSVKLRVVSDRLVHGMEVVQDQVLLNVRHQLHQRFAGSNDVGGSHLHLVRVLFALRDLGQLRFRLTFGELTDFCARNGRRSENNYFVTNASSSYGSRPSQTDDIPSKFSSMLRTSSLRRVLYDLSSASFDCGLIRLLDMTSCDSITIK